FDKQWARSISIDFSAAGKHRLQHGAQTHQGRVRFHGHVFKRGGLYLRRWRRGIVLRFRREIRGIGPAPLTIFPPPRRALTPRAAHRTGPSRARPFGTDGWLLQPAVGKRRAREKFSTRTRVGEC